MPELPDVEGFRRFFARHAEGRRVVEVKVPDSAIVRNRSPHSLGRSLRGHRFGAPGRHGKWLIVPVEPPGQSSPHGVELLLHFGMTGLLSWGDDQHDRHRHDRLIFVCDGGELRYNNMRRFGGVWLAADERERDAVTGPLGPDALALDRERFERLISGRRAGVKAALMDQRLIAGIGNLLSDEILWRARVNPRTQLADLSRRRRDAIYRALHEAVSESVRYGRVPHGQRWLTRVRDDREPRCPRCGMRLRRATVAGRTACWCPRCQRR